MRQYLRVFDFAVLLASAALWMHSSLVRGADAESSELAAGKLLATTVTVRVLPARPPAGIKPAEPAENQQEVTVCTGVSVGPGLIVTFAHRGERQPPAPARFRVTLPEGMQAEPAVRVVDRYSGLSLLEVSQRDLPVLELAAEAPQVGGVVLTAAAAGIETPNVSQGIVSGIDRSIGGTDLPPLLQCDVRTTEASSGAAVVDRSGKLVGIVVATTSPADRTGWAFAVPARHVQRLIDARREGQLVVLERRRPIVGLTMGSGAQEGTVAVERVEPGGPAEKAGINPGDVILEADGRKIRSAYQAVDLILKRQPGERIAFIVQQGAERKAVDVTLGGTAAAAPSGASELQRAVVGPQLNVRVVGRNQIEVRNGAISELGIGGASPRSPGDEVGMLKTQLSAFEKVIAKLQTELRRRDETQAQTEELVKSLREEVDQLREQVEKEEVGK